MGRYTNPGNGKFQESLDTDIYVDKTGLLSFTNHYIKTKKKYICVSRPRRFGKTMAAEMLCAYYSRSCDSREMFQGLKISRDGSFEKHLNKYDVIQVDMRPFLSKVDFYVPKMISNLTDALVEELRKEYSQITISGECLDDVLWSVFSQTGIPFVFIIDEWDCIFRRNKDDIVGQRKYLDFLNTLLKDQAYVALAYMTGILPIKKYGEHSALNMFTEISMTDASPLEEYTGFTEDEVKELCTRYNRNYEDIKAWYDGYTVEGISIYNPKSVYETLTRGHIRNYWTHTEAFEDLKYYFTANSHGEQEAAYKLIAKEELEINPDKFENDMVTRNSLDDILTLLVHLGYLTYDSATKRVRIPNEEVRTQFVNAIEDLGGSDVVTALKNSDELLKATYECDEERVAYLIDEVHRENTSILHYNDENSLACVISMAYMSAKDKYTMELEKPTGNGFADLVYLPKAGVRDPALVVELKYNKSAQTALDQIKEKKYASPLRGYSGDILLVGINYDKETKEHTCRIEKITK